MGGEWRVNIIKTYCMLVWSFNELIKYSINNLIVIFLGIFPTLWCNYWQWTGFECSISSHLCFLKETFRERNSLIGKGVSLCWRHIPEELMRWQQCIVFVERMKVNGLRWPVTETTKGKHPVKTTAGLLLVMCILELPCHCILRKKTILFLWNPPFAVELYKL